jgi:hypothetical protein
MAVQGVVREVAAMTDRDAGVRAESLARVGWFQATAPLWPLGLARILLGSRGELGARVAGLSTRVAGIRESRA